MGGLGQGMYKNVFMQINLGIYLYAVILSPPKKGFCFGFFNRCFSTGKQNAKLR